MTDSQQYEFLSQVLVRTPFYSFRDYAPGNLGAVLQREDFRNALWLASMDFYRLLEKKDFDLGKLGARERHTLLKYYNRMSFRPTPFGSFAAFSLARWGIDRDLRLAKQADTLLHLQPSLTWKAMNGVNDIPAENIVIAANPTLYRVGKEWRYTQSVQESSGKLVFSLQAIDANPTNDMLIKLTRQAPVKSLVIIQALVNYSNCPEGEAADYLAFLLQDQVLLSGDFAGLIENSDLDIMALNDEPQRPSHVKIAVTGKLSRFDAPQQPFYSGLERPVYEGEVDLKIQQDLLDTLKMLSRIVPQFANREQQDFISAFKARFDAQKVPLLKALDPDTGISYGGLHNDIAAGHALEKIRFPVKGNARNELEWTAVHRLFLSIWLSNSKRGPFDPVIITDNDIKGLEPAEPPLQLPPTIPLLFTRTAGFTQLDSAGGASATALSGRFSMFSPELEGLCRELAEAESTANPDVIFAEIHQRSHLHVDNINRRRRVYDYIIPINVFPSPEQPGQLFPDDLVISVKQDTILLESISLGKRVIPRLPTAYNYHHNELALFRFLCDLQFQDLRADLMLNPERLYPGMPFYPRIVYRRCILSLARWHLRQEELGQLCTKPYSLGRLHLFRQERGIPAKISLGISDQQLVFDLACDEEALFFLECLREEKTSAVIREYLPPDVSVTAEKQPLAAQAMAFLKRGQAVYHSLPFEGKVTRQGITRAFMPGSEWLYIKIYCTPQSADRILLDVIQPVLEKNKEKINCWFFIRFQDPEPHLRVRFRTANPNASFLLDDLRRLLSKGKHRELIRELRSDTYNREIERYSALLMEAVEQFFAAGSDYILKLRAFQKVNPDVQLAIEASRMTWAMCLTYFARLPDTVSFLEQNSKRFMQEFSTAEKLHADLNLKYRELARTLRVLMEEPAMVNKAPVSMHKILDILGSLVVKTNGWSAGRRNNLLADLVHMQLNRLFSSRQREHEAMIYYVLCKYALSLAARQKPI